MASTEVYDALKAHLQATFSPPYQVLDFDAIDTILVNGEDPFIVIEEGAQLEDMTAFGDPQNLCHREAGVVLMHFFTPAPESSATARALAQSVQDAFRLQYLSGVRVVSVSPPDLSAMNDGIWTVGVIAIDYEYDRYLSRNP